MKILSLLSIIFILEVKGKTTTYPLCTEGGCLCQNVKSVSLEISKCVRPVNITLRSNSIDKPFTSIRFSEMIIGNFGANSTKSFTDLDHVEFSKSEIKYMHPQAFAANELSTLTFTNCKFGNFSSIESLDIEELLITNCTLKAIPKLVELPSLTILHLEGNKINAIKEDTFATSELLEEVYLSNNELTNLPQKLFDLNGQLSTLDFSHNFLSSFVLDGTINLEVLLLANNQITKFDSNSTKFLKHLRALDLSHNRITHVTHETFMNMPYLNMINLGYNQLTVLDNNTFADNTNLEKLVLDGNNFKTLPIFQSHTDIFQRIYNFSCKKCGIVSLSSFTFGSMPGLVQINLSGNDLSILDPKAFSLVNSLKILNLSKNKLRKLGGNLFSDNKELIEINLSGNPLTTLDPKDFIILENLRKLDASNAQLTSLWADNYGYVLKKLEQLIISNNSIEDITSSDLKVMPNLKYIDLENNPIQCTIHLANLIKWLTIHEVYSAKGAKYLRTNEKLLDDTIFAQYFDHNYDHKTQWQKLAELACVPSDDELKNINTDIVMNLIIKDARELDSVPKVDAPQIAPVYDENDESDENDDGDSVDDADLEEVDSVVESKDEFSLNQATYIISVTSVFVITALVVLSAAVSITLVVLKRHNTLNINNANIPRIKIPIWENMPSQKKHSGSIYRPLSEEIITPPTPKFNRYEFKSTPIVHNSMP